MKVNFECTEKEAKRIIGKPLIDRIKLPKIKLDDIVKKEMIIAAFILLVIAFTFQYGRQGGLAESSRMYNTGYDSGKDYGERVCYTNTYQTIESASRGYLIANIGKVFSWIGLVVGISWIIHGVGFRVL